MRSCEVCICILHDRVFSAWWSVQWIECWQEKTSASLERSDRQTLNLWIQIMLCFVHLPTIISMSISLCSSESATVCVDISLSICYWLVKCRDLHVLCACETGSHSHLSTSAILFAACVCVCERERDVTSQRSVLPVRNGLKSQLVCKHIRASSQCLSRDSVPLSGWTDGKTKDIINDL